ncbi:MAG: ThuA domain-containing protein [Pirellulales bacterium]|nr:ThuA domain-containing protein [Pirellulales bacterium]
MRLLCYMMTAWITCCFVGTRQVDAEQPHIVFLIAEREYQTEQTLPDFCKQYVRDGKSSFVYADPHEPNKLIGSEAVDTADLLVVSVRRRTLPPQQLNRIRRYVESGKPVIGIRTASHAFCLRNKPPEDGFAAWPEFDSTVFGGNYTNHYKNSLVATIQRVNPSSPSAESLLSGIKELPCTSGGSLYRVAPLEEKAEVVLEGVVEGHAPEPVAWTFLRTDGGKSFYTSLGHVDDFHGPVLPHLLSNAIKWCLHE